MYKLAAGRRNGKLTTEEVQIKGLTKQPHLHSQELAFLTPLSISILFETEEKHMNSPKTPPSLQNVSPKQRLLFVWV